MRKSIPLSELGYRLPIGYPVSGSLNRELELGKWTWQTEKEVAEARQKAGLTPARFVGEILASVVKVFGGVDFSELKRPERLAVLRNAFMGDVLYTYVLIRRDAIGSLVDLEAICPNCRSRFNLEVDLNELEAEVLEVEAERELENAINFPVNLNGTPYSRAVIRPTRWGALWRFSPAEVNEAILKHAIISDSVLRLEGESGAVHNPFADEKNMEWLTKLQIDDLLAEIDDWNAGIKLLIDYECPVCLSEQVAQLDWSFDSFFSAFSRRKKRKSYGKSFSP